MEELFTEMSQKAHTLSSWSREQVVVVNRLKGAWDRLQNLLDNYQHIMEKQVSLIIIYIRYRHLHIFINNCQKYCGVFM